MPNFWNKLKTADRTVLALRLLTGLFFIYNGFLFALAVPSEIWLCLNSHGISNDIAVNAIANYAPYLTLLAGAFIFAGIFTKTTAYFAAAVSFAASIMTFSAIIGNKEVFYCGAPFISAPSYAMLALNTAAVVLSVLIATLPNRSSLFSFDIWINNAKS